MWAWTSAELRPLVSTGARVDTAVEPNQDFRLSTHLSARIAQDKTRGKNRKPQTLNPELNHPSK